MTALEPGSERLDSAVIDQRFRALTGPFQLRCEGATHPRCEKGHDGGPARFALTFRCPLCGFQQVYLLCAGRAKLLFFHHGTSSCPGCSQHIPIDQHLLRIEELA